MVGRGLSLDISGLNLDRKIWQSAHLWCSVDCWTNRRFLQS